MKKGLCLFRAWQRGGVAQTRETEEAFPLRFIPCADADETSTFPVPEIQSDLNGFVEMGSCAIFSCSTRVAIRDPIPIG